MFFVLLPRELRFFYQFYNLMLVYHLSFYSNIYYFICFISIWRPFYNSQYNVFSIKTNLNKQSLTSSCLWWLGPWNEWKRSITSSKNHLDIFTSISKPGARKNKIYSRKPSQSSISNYLEKFINWWAIKTYLCTAFTATVTVNGFQCLHMKFYDHNSMALI